jgi:hypothetical protein
MREIKAYECEYCNKKMLRSKSGMRNYENRCFWNPKTKACMTCKNYIGGGHYNGQCDLYFMNTNEELKINRTIKKLMHHCEYYVFDKLTLEERKLLNDELNFDAQYDHDCYNANRM